MMSDWPVLSLVIFLPLVGVLFILATPGNDQAQVDSNCRWQALVVSVGVFLLSLLIWYNFDPTTAVFQMLERYEWVPGSAFAYHVGVDGISMWRSEEHTSELQYIIRNSQADFGMKKK